MSQKSARSDVSPKRVHSRLSRYSKDYPVVSKSHLEAKEDWASTGSKETGNRTANSTTANDENFSCSEDSELSVQSLLDQSEFSLLTTSPEPKDAPDSHCTHEVNPILFELPIR